MRPISSVAVVGVGLVGGSLAAALKEHVPDLVIHGVDPDENTRALALERGLVDEVSSPDDALAQGLFGPDGVDLVVLATPAVAVTEWLRMLEDAGYAGIITDVASTKASVVEVARTVLTKAEFVGGHPMAGSEHSGVAAARADLFTGAYYVLTPLPTTDPEVFSALHSLVTSIGARVVTIPAEKHDEAVAVVSHVPHVAAAALVALAASRAEDSTEVLRLAAGGFKDTTRIAAGSPELWTGICLDNADAVVDALGELRALISGFEAMVRSGEPGTITGWFARAATVRRSLPTQWVPETESLTELRVPLLDRPGVVGEVTSAVSQAGCNIEGIDLDHTSEDTAVLSLVLTDEGDFRALLRDLAALGYEPSLIPLESSEDGDVAW